MSDNLLANRYFVRLWIGQAASFVGDAVSMVALVILVVQITGSASAVGGALVARLLPSLISPLFGVLADRLDRRMVLVAADLSRALLAVGFVFVRDLIILYVLIFLMGAARAAFNPTVRAAFPSIVGGGDLTRANSLISTTFSVSLTVGPALGGLLVASVGVGTAFLLDAVTFLFSAVLLYRIPLPRPEGGQDEEVSLLQELRSGFSYLAAARVPLALVCGSFLLVLTTDLATPAEVFLAKETFGAGDAGYGLLVGIWGGGMVAGSAATGVLGDRLPLLYLYFVSAFVWAAALVGTGVAPSFALALGALAVAGIMNGIDNVATDTILQQRVPDALLGRVFSVRFTGYSTAEVIAYPLGGLLVDSTGPSQTYTIAGIATIAAGLLILLLVVSASAKQDGG